MQEKEQVQWYIPMPDGLWGPYTSEQIAQLYSTNQINETTCVLKQTTHRVGQLNIAQLSQHDGEEQESAQENAEPITLPKKVQACLKVNNTALLWYSVMAAVLAVAFVLCLTGNYNIGRPLITLGSLTTMSSVIPLSVDVMRVKRALYGFEPWMLTAYLITPVYLFMRAHKTDKNYAYGIVGIGSYIAALIMFAIVIIAFCQAWVDTQTVLTFA